jgi:hypothetical protein
MKARPGPQFQWRPECEVVEMRGKYQGASALLPIYLFEDAVEVLLAYPDGSQYWHLGPAAAGTCHPEAIAEAA